jgi:flagellar motor switch protein FliG
MSNPSEQITGTQRAAAFLLSLEREEAAEVLKHLDESVIVEVVEAMAQLDAEMTRPESIKELDRDFIRSLSKPRGARLRSEGELREMLEKTLGKAQAEALFEKIHHRLVHERPFIAIERHEPTAIAAALSRESEAVCALVLAHLDPPLAADVIGALEGERALEVVRRMATLAPPGFDTLFAIAQDLERALEEISSGPVAPLPSERIRTVAEILNYSKADVERNVLESLSEDDQELAAEIREFMFTWEDLAKVDRRAMQKILAAVDTRTLAVALKACSQRVEQNILSNLSSRVVEMVADERDIAGALPMNEVLAARAEIMRAVRALMEAGEFRPARAGEDLVS